MELDKIYNEDCNVTIANRIEDKSIDLVLTSPPYNMTKRKGGYADTGRYDVYKDWKSEDEYIDDTIDLFDKFDRIIKENGIVLYNFSYSVENPSLPYKLVAEIAKRTSWDLADTIMWKKKSCIPVPGQPRRLTRAWEFVWVFCRKDEKDTFNVYKGVKTISPKTGQKFYNLFYNIIDAKNNDGKTNSINQATYSSELCEKLFRLYAKEGDVVYDPFMGTGTTAVACKNKGLHYIGSEISEKQCKYAEERLNSIE